VAASSAFLCSTALKDICARLRVEPVSVLNHEVLGKDSFKYNQQDAMLYNILYYHQALHVLGGFSAHHQDLKNCTHSIWYVPSLLAATINVVDLELNHGNGSGKRAWHIADAVCTVLELLMMGLETAQNM
jgi:hypothetical protein